MIISILIALQRNGASIEKQNTRSPFSRNEPLDKSDENEQRRMKYRAKKRHVTAGNLPQRWSMTGKWRNRANIIDKKRAQCGYSTKTSHIYVRYSELNAVVILFENSNALSVDPHRSLEQRY